MSQGQWTIDSWLTVSQKLSLAHIGSEDICDLVTSLVLKEVLSIIVTHIPLLQSSRKEFLKFNLAVLKFCHIQIWRRCNPEYCRLECQPKIKYFRNKVQYTRDKTPKT